MKFRVRSRATGQTHRIDIPDASTVAELKTLVARHLSLAVPPDSLHLSLNGADDLVPQNPEDPLPLLGLLSGDTLYVSLDPQSLNLAPPSNPNSNDVPMHMDVAHVEAEPDVQPVTVQKMTIPPPNPNSNDVSMDMDPACVEAESDVKPIMVQKMTIPCFLNRVMEAEKGQSESVLGRLVIFVHAAFLESGFVVSGAGESELPKDWASKASGLSVKYTVGDIGGGRCVEVRFSVIGVHATVYGCLVGSRDVYRVAMNLGKLAALLSSDMSDLGEQEAKEVFQMWKVVKDGLSLPLLIDLCVASGIELPSCFMSLPTELKMKIVGCLPGDDVARVGCTCTELRFLSSNDDLWKQKFEEEFRSLEKNARGRNWKERYANKYEARASYFNRINKCIEEENKRRRLIGFPFNGAPRIYPGGLPRCPAIGGDHDIFPDFNNMFPLRYPMGLPGFPAGRRNFSPNCDLSRLL